MGYASLRILLSTAAANDMVISNFDIKNAFCNSIENDHLYMTSPPGVNQWETINGNPAALKLLQALYGTKQASFLLNKRLNSLWECRWLYPLCVRSMLIQKR